VTEVLLLNASFEPLRLVSVKKAIMLLLQEKAEVVEAAEARLRELCPGGQLRIDSNAPSGPVATANRHARRLAAVGGLEVAPKQAWTPVAEFGRAGVPAVNFGPGDPAFAHRRDEQVRIDALVRSFRTLETVLCG